MQWLRDGLQSIELLAVERHQEKAGYDSAGVYFVPAFTGLGAPYWDQYARGAIAGTLAERRSIISLKLQSNLSLSNRQMF